MTMSMPSAAAIRPRDPCTTNTLGSGKPCDCEPALTLDLRGLAGALRPLRKEDDLPAPLRGHRGEPLDHAGFQFLQCAPEVLDRLDVLPEAPLLAQRHLHFEQRRNVVGRSFGGGLLRILGAGRRRGGRVRRRAASGASRSPRHRLAEQRLGLPDQFRLHVGEHAVEVECDAQCHFFTFLKERASGARLTNLTGTKPRWFSWFRSAC